MLAKGVCKDQDMERLANLFTLLQFEIHDPHDQVVSFVAKTMKRKFITWRGRPIEMLRGYEQSEESDV